MKTLVLLPFTTTVAAPMASAQTPAPRHAQSPVEESNIARSLRESRTAPTAFCTLERTRFPDVQFEDRYTFRSVATRTSDGRVTDANVQTVGDLRGCVGQTVDPLVVNFYAEGQLSGVALIASGQCRAPRADHPEPGTRFSACSFAFRGLPAPYVGGHLTTSDDDVAAGRRRHLQSARLRATVHCHHSSVEEAMRARC